MAGPTTPQLGSDAEVINFEQVQSCGTSTAVSLPCMFLDVGRAGFADTLAGRRENLFDVLQRVGYSVLWRDNNSGCKGLCDRVPRDDLTHANVAGLCTGDECYDEILLHGLQEKLDAFRGDAVVVLHMKGSHGPAYHLRLPAAIRILHAGVQGEPVRQLRTLGHRQRLRQHAALHRSRARAHDRAVAPERRSGSTRRSSTCPITANRSVSVACSCTAYLTAFAPPEQTHVPMLMWISQGAQHRFGIDVACLRRKRQEPMSHDNLYHSTLGLLGVQTRLYRAGHDLFRSCRPAQDAPSDAAVEGLALR